MIMLLLDAPVLVAFFATPAFRRLSSLEFSAALVARVQLFVVAALLLNSG